MFERNAVIAVYDTHAEAEEAVRELKRSEFDMKKLSLIGKDVHSEEEVVGYYSAGDRIKYWGKLSAFWGGIWGSLAGWAFFAVPGVGPVLVAGPLSGWMIASLEDAVVVGGMTAFGAALYGIGIPRDSILRYERALKENRYLLIACGTEPEVSRAKDILSKTRMAESAVHAG